MFVIAFAYNQVIEPFPTGGGYRIATVPLGFQAWKLGTALGFVLLLVWLNLRGAKESIRDLLPIFLRFVAHALPWVQRMVDAHAYGGDGEIDRLPGEADATLADFVGFCRSHGIPATGRLTFGTDPVATLTDLCGDVTRDFPNAVFFTSRLVFRHDGVLTRLPHVDGVQMILPMKI